MIVRYGELGEIGSKNEKGRKNRGEELEKSIEIRMKQEQGMRCG
jgi:hypothetical protein